MRKRIYLLFTLILGIALYAYPQNTRQLYKDALIFELKGHVKKCIVKTITETTDDTPFGNFLDGESEYVYEFTSSGEYISDRKNRTARHDKEGKLIFEKFLEEALLFPDITNIKEISYRYDSKGYLIEEFGKEPLDESFQSFKYTYIYDDKGFVREFKLTTGTSTSSVYTYQILSVDKRGNWIKRICKSDIGTTTETRTIYYYDKDETNLEEEIAKKREILESIGKLASEKSKNEAPPFGF